jgi:excisionase family DNA binding protein
METALGSKTVFTTGEIAKLFDVNINTVVNWIETGLLKGFTLPGSNTRRVPRAELIEFISKQDFHLKDIPGQPVEALLVSPDPGLVQQFRAAAESGFGYLIQTASCAFEAGIVCAQAAPAAIFVHRGRTDFDPHEFRRHAGRLAHLAQARLIAVTATAAGTAELSRKGFDSLLPLPADSNAILDAIDTAAASQSTGSKIPFMKH